jgi:hypothetical protein
VKSLAERFKENVSPKMLKIVKNTIKNTSRDQKGPTIQEFLKVNLSLDFVNSNNRFRLLSHFKTPYRGSKTF